MFIIIKCMFHVLESPNRNLWYGKPYRLFLFLLFLFVLMNFQSQNICCIWINLAIPGNWFFTNIFVPFWIEKNHLTLFPRANRVNADLEEEKKRHSRGNNMTWFIGILLKWVPAKQKTRKKKTKNDVIGVASDDQGSCKSRVWSNQQKHIANDGNIWSLKSILESNNKILYLSHQFHTGFP